VWGGATKALLAFAFGDKTKDRDNMLGAR